jgi:predicted Zn-dependent peptidase
MLKQFKLKNGLNVVSYSIPQMRSVFMAISVKAGALFDTPKTCGSAHFMEHILVQATPTFPTVEELAAFIESIAGHYNATTYPERIRFNASGPAEYTKDLLKIAGEAFFEPLFKESDIERERGAVTEEIRQKEDSLAYKNYKFFKNVRFKKGSPLLLDNGGTLETVATLTKKDLVSYWQRFFDPSNAYVVIVGGFDPKSIESELENTFKKYKSVKSFEGFPKMSNKDLTDRTVSIRFDEKLNGCYISLSFPSLTDESPLKERIAEGLARSILVNLRTSRLYRLLRQQLGLVYGIGFGAARYRDLGYVSIDSQAHIDKIEEVLKHINDELHLFINDGITDEEYLLAKNYSKNQALMQFDHPGAIGSWIEDDLLWEDKIYDPDEYAEIIESVTKEEIGEIVRKNWDFSKLNLTIQGPIEDTTKNRKKFADLIKDLK